MQILPMAMRMRTRAATAAGGLDAQISNPERALDGALRDRNVLDVRECHSHFLHADDSFAHPQAAVGNNVPALFKIEAQHGQPKQADESKNCEHKKWNEQQRP